MNTNQVGHIIAAASLIHPLHNKELHRHLVCEFGAKKATELLASASEHVAFRRRRHLLAFLERA